MTQMPPPPPMQDPSMGGAGMSPEVPGATAGLVLGIVSIVVNFPVVGLVLAFIGFQKAREAKTLCEMNPGFYSNSGLAQAAHILCIIGLCLGGLSTLCGCGYFVVIALALAGGAAGGGGGGF